MQQPFEDEFSDAADGTSDLMAEGEEGMEDGFMGDELDAADGFEEGDGMDAADGFEGDGMEDGFEGDGMDFESDGFEGDGMEDGFEGEAMDLESDGFEGDALDSEDAHQLEDAFADALAAQDEDEFMRLLGAGLRRVAAQAAPALRRVVQRAAPIAMRMVRQAAPQLGNVLREEAGRALSGVLSADAMDGFADAAADFASDEDLDAYAAMTGGLAARHVVRSVTSPGRRAQQPRQVRALGRQVSRASTQLARNLVRRYGPRALTAATRVVRQVTRMVRQQGASPTAVPRMIRRAGSRVLRSPRAVRQLARPTRAARQLRVQAGVRRPNHVGRWSPTSGGSPGTGQRRRMRTVTLRAPVRVIVRR